ncbi:hypothetical protein [Salipiger mucosus]|uniref:Uncharacterized protein n=1 Tax=Salipiger mucosus DSM 16094 TaxID=1123237 RepID=S9Q9B6_9RHOB|nr:hypothetical protein [Salipiger mucosus]EPX77971.1 hypothetical protein Salmuc_03293 [Salipiger mucosus DSM 16094]
MDKQKLLDFVTRATVSGNMQSRIGEARRLAGMTLKEAMKGPKSLRTAVQGVAEAQQFAEAEQATWQQPEDITAPGRSPIDACDTRHWLAMAEMAGVPTVPARTILSLSEEEFGKVAGEVKIPEAIRKPIKRHFEKAFRSEIVARDTDAHPAGRSTEELHQSLYDAMDDVPSGYMVRSHISGSSLLKAVAGTGLIEGASEFTDLGGGMKLGPGYITAGNRRCIDTRDERTVGLYAKGHSSPDLDIHFLARPWITASRFLEAEDPHRHGSIFAGKGQWPCEWRVFVEHGTVVGVSSYYAWICDPEPENAFRALEAADSAQRIVDKAKELEIETRILDLEFVRRGGKHPTISRKWARDDLSCTLDFIETEEGPMLLEGGPGHNPVSGAHPCGFMGAGIDKGWCDTHGVALRAMPHINLGEPKTWKDGKRRDCILTWDDARDLANDFTPSATPAP